MHAVDTNVLARYYLRDDAAQARVADRILSGGNVFVPKTAMLELETEGAKYMRAVVFVTERTRG